MRVIATYCHFVCLSARLSHGEPCKNGRTDRDAVWVIDSRGTKKPCKMWVHIGARRLLENTIERPVLGGNVDCRM